MLAGLALLMAVGCGKTARQGQSSVYLVVDRLQAAAGSSLELKDVLESDVLTKGSIFEDLGSVQLHAQMKDPGLPGSPLTPALANVITLERYHVNYVRSDGRNVQGVDVPYSFDGGVSGSIVDKTVTLGFVLVRGQAKAEAPLRALREAGGALLISTIADITFYGHDQAGNAVAVTAKISVNFADWADPS